MRINGSVTGMESERSYSAVSYSERSLKATKVSGSGIEGGLGFGARGGASSFLDTLLGKYEDKGGKEDIDESPEGEKTEEKTPSITDIMGNMTIRGVKPEESAEAVRSDSELYARKMSFLYIFSILFEDYRKRIDDLMADLRSGYETCNSGRTYAENRISSDQTPSLAKLEMTEKHYFKEVEDTGFRTKGKAFTEDGREIEFNIDVHMSREFEEYYEGRVKGSAPHYIDPLVINLESGITGISDQEFYFDLDTDGKEEKIKTLSPGSGFLALDINSDGKINDGSELFGTRSGNGFEELARFDTDRDGWIDEDDDVFDKLSVWVKEKDGSDKLLSLKDAGIGAINLMNAPTEYSLKDETYKTNAIIRATGMFLYEDGRAGTVQQVDMVS